MYTGWFNCMIFNTYRVEQNKFTSEDMSIVPELDFRKL